MECFLAPADNFPPLQAEPHEERRLACLQRLHILDTPEEDAFDRLTRMGARLFQAPICLVSLVDECRQWFKSHHGLAARETPRTVSFCAVAITGPTPLVVLDARKDHRFAENELVTGPPGIRFYAGAQLISRDGYPLGTFCVIDTEPREAFTPEQVQTLQDLASITVVHLEERLTRIFEAEAASSKGDTPSTSRDHSTGICSRQVCQCLSDLV